MATTPLIVQERQRRLKALQDQQRTAAAVPPPQPTGRRGAQPINPSRPSTIPDVEFNIPGNTGGARPARPPQSRGSQMTGAMRDMGGPSVATPGVDFAARGGMGAQSAATPSAPQKSFGRRVVEGESPMDLYRRGEISATELRDFSGQAMTVQEGARRRGGILAGGQQEIDAEQAQIAEQERQRQEIEQRREQARFEQQLKLEGLSKRDVQEYNRRLEGINELEASGRYDEEDIADFRAQLEEWRAGVEKRPKSLEPEEDVSPQEQFEQSIVEFNGRKGQFVNGQFKELPEAQQEGPDPAEVAKEQEKAQSTALKEWNAARKEAYESINSNVMEEGAQRDPTPAEILAQMMKNREQEAEALETLQSAGVIPAPTGGTPESTRGAEGVAGTEPPTDIIHPEHGPLRKGPDGLWYPIGE